MGQPQKPSPPSTRTFLGLEAPFSAKSCVDETFAGEGIWKLETPTNRQIRTLDFIIILQTNWEPSSKYKKLLTSTRSNAPRRREMDEPSTAIP